MTGPDDPYGRRALFTPPPGSRPAGNPGPPAGEGRRALFSEPAPAATARPAAGPRGRGRVVVRCRTCLARRAVGLGELAGHLIPSVWLPGRRWPVLMRCPTCGRTAWCRVEWGSLLSR